MPILSEGQPTRLEFELRESLAHEGKTNAQYEMKPPQSLQPKAQPPVRQVELR